MAKTRSQTASIPIKEEERKNTQLLHSASTTMTRNKITKRRTSKRQSSVSIVRQIKLEEESDEKPALKILPGKKKRSVVTEKQIEQLIDCVENKNMTVSAASRMVKIDYWTGAKYYNRYKKYPKKNSFSQKNPISIYTHDQIKTLFGYIIDDGMSLREASRTTNMTFSAVQAYCKRYTEDPNHNIPLPASELNKHNNACTQDQVKRLIHYIVKKNMSIQAASIKTDMGYHTARRYYERYLEDPNHKIPVPVKSGFSGRRITREQIEALINYIVNDNISIECASKKSQHV
jgi:transposase